MIQLVLAGVTGVFCMVERGKPKAKLVVAGEAAELAPATASESLALPLRH
jgi:hypothetical protein